MATLENGQFPLKGLTAAEGLSGPVNRKPDKACDARPRRERKRAS